MSENPNPQGDPTPNPGDPTSVPGPNPQGDPVVPAGDETLGEAGKAALKSERDARKAAEKSSKEATEKVAELEAEVKRLQRSNAAVKGVDLESIKTEIQAEFDAQLVTAEIKAEAKGKVRDAGEVISRYPEFFKDLKAGDEAGITKAVEDLLKAKPYLSAEPSERWGDVGGGNRKTPNTEPTSPQERMARAYGSK